MHRQAVAHGSGALGPGALATAQLHRGLCDWEMRPKATFPLRKEKGWRCGYGWGPVAGSEAYWGTSSYRADGSFP